MQFASPYFLWLLAVIPLMVVYYVWRTRQGGASIQVSTIDGVAEAPRTVRYYLRHLPFALRCAAVALLIVALARPQSVDEGSTSNTEGIDIVLAIDISTSMLAQDLQPDRIQAAKQVAGNVHHRPPRRPHRTGGLRGRSLHPKPADDRSGNAANPAGTPAQRRGGGRHGHRQRTGDGNQPPAREQRQEQGHHPADRRREQPGRNRSPHGCGDRP